MKILSFDIEEWFFHKSKSNGEWKILQLDEMLSRILDILESHSFYATFFCIGEMAVNFPEVIKKIRSRGHEIGCHSHSHKWVNSMTADEFYEDTRISIDKLEQCIGEKIESYRAPAFTITESNKWAFEVIGECGIKNDASIFPSSRDYGGFPSYPIKDSPSKIKFRNTELNEFPINITKLPFIGKEIAFTGGGYFRLLPLQFVESLINRSNYTMCYFHLEDLLDYKTPLFSKKDFEAYYKVKGTLKNRYLRYFKSNVGKGRAFKGLENLLNTYKFISIKEATRSSNDFPIVTL